MPVLSDQNESSDSPSIGVLLQQTREAKQWTVRDVAHRLNLNEKIIQTLESGLEQMEQQLNPVYCRGYLRSYMRLLGLESDNILSALPPTHERVFRSQELDSMTDLPVFRHTRARQFRLRRWTGGVIFVLVFLVSLWWYQQSHYQSSKIQLPMVQASQQEPVALPKTMVSQSQSQGQGQGQYKVSPVTSGTVTGT